MGFKSRSNWKLGFCMKTDCLNRDKLCEDCFRFSLYEVDKKSCHRERKEHKSQQ